MVAAYIISRKRFVMHKFVDFTCIQPAALPSIFLGIGYSISSRGLLWTSTARRRSSF